MTKSAVSELGSFRFSTADLPDHDRFAIFREVFGHKIMRMDFTALDHGFHADIALRSFPDLGVVSAEHSPMHFGRSSQLLDDGDDRLAFSISTTGGQVTQLGREGSFEPGGAILISSGDAFAFRPHAETGANPSPGQPKSQCLIMAMSREKLRRSLADFDGVLVRGIPAQAPALSLLRRYVSTLQETMLTPELAQLGVNHIYDLVAMAFGPTRDAAHLARQGGVPAARLHAIKSDILGNPGQHALSLNALAARYGISPVYIRKLFDSEGLSFSRFVLEQRLQLARRLLTDPRHQSLTIAAIAFDAGFDDLSYFNRVFRRRFGMTPTTMRVEATRKLD